MATDATPEVFSVSRLTGSIRELLESAFPQVWVEGEVSNFRRQDSGHCYFTLKDEGAQLACVLFRQSAMRQQGPLGDGMHVAAFGRISVYPPKGGYQLICQIVTPAGAGALAERFQKLKTMLAAEGLFDASRKKPLPSLPLRVGIITSPTGAVIRDFLSILSRDGWKGSVTILPARVQGDGAAAQIARMVALAGRSGCYDVVVLARGGGSLEDLWPFNEEIVARAVAACPVPTISGVGHETDFTLCDFAADCRAETPSAAAEMISSLRAEAQMRVAQAERALQSRFVQELERAKARCRLAGARLATHAPGRVVESARLRIGGLGTRLGLAMKRRIEAMRATLAADGARIGRAYPVNIQQLHGRLEKLHLRLEGLNPSGILARGYAILGREDGAIVSSSAELQSGERIRITMHDGAKRATVE
jgi:exodeoxyribonuclease VII large subunit